MEKSWTDSTGSAEGSHSATVARVEGSGAAAVGPHSAEHRARLVSAVHSDFQFIWRCLRRFGIEPDYCVDDAAQRVFEIAVARIATIQVGHERAFLFKTALWVAREFRRKRARRRELVDSELVDETADDRDPDPEQLLEQRRWRDRLDVLLEGLPIDVRSVFVLYELEGLQLDEIAALLEIPQGTVASRLRRARSIFLSRARRLKAHTELIKVKP